MPTISVVIPVYRAEECLRELYRRLKLALESITTSFEIVLVEDGGGDSSWKIIEELARADARVKGIQFSRNFGQHYERVAGETTYDWPKLIKLAAEAIIAYSDKPLRLAINLGFVVSALSFAWGVVIAFRAIVYGSPIEGWASLMVSIWFMGGII